MVSILLVGVGTQLYAYGIQMATYSTPIPMIVRSTQWPLAPMVSILLVGVGTQLYACGIRKASYSTPTPMMMWS